MNDDYSYTCVVQQLCVETTPSSQPYFQATKKGAPAVATACPPRRLHHNHRRYRDTTPRWSTDRNIPHQFLQEHPHTRGFVNCPTQKKKKKKRRMTTTSSPSLLFYLVFSLTFLSVPCPPPPELSTHVFLFLFLFCCVVYLLHEPRGASPSSSSYFSIAHTLLPSVFTDSLTNQHSVTTTLSPFA